MAIIKPYITSKRYTATIADGTGTGATFAIAATTFTDDSGAAVTAFPASYGFYNLFINGILQTGDTSTLTTATLTIPDGDALDGGIPVTVEFIIN